MMEEVNERGTALLTSDDASAGPAPKNELTPIAKALLTTVSAKQVLARTSRDIESGYLMAGVYILIAAVQVVGAAFMFWCIAQALELWSFLEWSKPAWVIATPAYNLSLQIFFSILSLALFKKLGYQIYDAWPDFSKDSKQSKSEAFITAISQFVTTCLFAYLTFEAVFGFAAMSGDAAEQCSVIESTDDSKLMFGASTVGAFSLLMAPGVMILVATLLYYAVDRVMKNAYQAGLLAIQIPVPFIGPIAPLAFLDEFMLKHNHKQYKEMQVHANINAKKISLRAFVNANMLPEEMPKEIANDSKRYLALTHEPMQSELEVIQNATAQWQRGEKLSDVDIVALHIAIETIKKVDPYHGRDNTVTLPWSWTLFSIVNFSSIVGAMSVIWANLARSGIGAMDVALSIATGIPTVFISSSQFTKSLYVDATANAFDYSAAIFHKKIDRDRRYLRNILIPGAVLSAASIVALAKKIYGDHWAIVLDMLWSTIVNNGAGIGKQLLAVITQFLCQTAMHQEGPNIAFQLASLPMKLLFKLFDLIEWLLVSLGGVPTPEQSESAKEDVARLALMQSLGELLEEGLTYSTPDNAYVFLQNIDNLGQGIKIVPDQYVQRELDELNEDECNALAMPTSAQAVANCSSGLLQAVWFSIAKSELGLSFSFKDDALMYGVAAFINIVPQVMANFFEKNKHVRAMPQLIEASFSPAIIGFIVSLLAEYGGHFLKQNHLQVESEAEFDGVFSLLECFIISMLAMHCAQYAPPITLLTDYIGSFCEKTKAPVDDHPLEDRKGDGYAGGYLSIFHGSFTSVDSAGVGNGQVNYV